MTGNPLYFPIFRAFDSTGAPLAGGKVYTYAAGTSTPKLTYTDNSLGTPNTNPVILDSYGTAPIWLSGSYKINLTDSTGVQQDGFPVDNFTNDSGATGPAGTFQMATAGGSVDAITATYSPVLTLANLVTCGFVALGANATTTPTFAPDGLAAHTITKKGGGALVPGDIPGALAVCFLEYNSANTRWELTNPASEKLPWVVATGTADAITATYIPAVGAVYDGLVLTFRATTANATTTPTFAPNGLTARTITKMGGSALAAGDIAANLAEYSIRYNLANTRWELLNPSTIAINNLATVTIDTTADYVPFYDASGTTVGKALAIAVNRPLVAKYSYTVASGTDGGATTSGSWQARPMNTEDYDDIGITLSGNAVTVPAGTYYMSAIMTFYDDATSTGGTKGKVRNTSDSTDVGFFQTGNMQAQSTIGATYLLTMSKTKITLAAPKALQIQYWVNAAQSPDGLGKSFSAAGTVEVYAEWIIERVA